MAVINVRNGLFIQKYGLKTAVKKNRLIF